MYYTNHFSLIQINSWTLVSPCKDCPSTWRECGRIPTSLSLGCAAHMSLSSERAVEIYVTVIWKNCWNIWHCHLEELNRITAQVDPKQEQNISFVRPSTSACVRSFLVFSCFSWYKPLCVRSILHVFSNVNCSKSKNCVPLWIKENINMMIPHAFKASDFSSC